MATRASVTTRLRRHTAPRAALEPERDRDTGRLAVAGGAPFAGRREPRRPDRALAGAELERAPGDGGCAAPRRQRTDPYRVGRRGDGRRRRRALPLRSCGAALRALARGRARAADALAVARRGPLPRRSARGRYRFFVGVDPPPCCRASQRL